MNKVIYCDSDNYSSNGLTENIANLIVNVVKKYSFTHILAGTSTFSKDVLPRCAGILDISQLSDVTSIIDNNTFERALYAGNAVCKVKSNDNIKLMTIRPTSFDSSIELNNNAEIEKYTEEIESCSTKQFVSDELSASSGPSLTSATVVKFYIFILLFSGIFCNDNIIC